MGNNQGIDERGHQNPGQISENRNGENSLAAGLDATHTKVHSRFQSLHQIAVDCKHHW
jgi:hypothetical protein